jgi:hypothetical protein
MKKLLIIFTAVMAITFLSVSCNKKLKENMDDLENSLNEEKSKNESLQSQVTSLNSILTKTPMTISFSTTNASDAAVSYNGTYSFVYGSDYNYSYVEDNGDGTYYVYVWRGADLGTDYYGRVSFTYNPTTGVVTNPSAETQGYGAGAESINASFSGVTNIAQTVTVNSFDFNAGSINFNYSATTAVAYTNVYTGKPMTFTASYSGALAKYYNN